MPMLPLIVLATLWHWAPPDSGAAPQWYDVRQRDPWGETMEAWDVTDTTTIVTYEPMPYRLQARAGCTDASGDTLRGPWSLSSSVYIPPRWRDLFWAMGRGLGNKGLSMTISAAARLSEAWPDSGR